MFQTERLHKDGGEGVKVGYESLRIYGKKHEKIAQFYTNGVFKSV